MSDIRARITSSHSSTASTDELVIAVESRTGADLPATGWTVSVSPTDKTPSAGWLTGAFEVGDVASKGAVSLPIGPNSVAGSLEPGASWPFVSVGGEVEPAGVIVLRGTSDPYVPPDGDGDYDGGEVTG